MIQLIRELVGRGACAVVLPAAMRLLGVTHLRTALDQPGDAERWMAMFVHEHAVVDGDRLWLHSHGMEQLDLPDVECLEHARRAGVARRIVSAVQRRLVAGGAALHFGDVVDVAGDGVPFEITASIPVDGHRFGAYGAVRLVRAQGERR